MFKVTKNSDNVTIKFPDAFGYSLRKEFKQLIDTHVRGTKYILDMGDLSRIDSSALGMLIMLREAAGGELANISFINMAPQVRSLLQIANFHKLFKFS